MHNLKKFSSVDPINGMTQAKPGKACNLVDGVWVTTNSTRSDIVDPLNGEQFLLIPDTTDYTKFVEDIKNKIAMELIIHYINPSVI